MIWIPDTVLVAGSVKKTERASSSSNSSRPGIPGKLRQWPRYAASKWLRYECPVKLLVICPDDITADRYAGPIPTSLDGLHATGRPFCGPRACPLLASAAQAMRRSRDGGHVGGLSRSGRRAVLNAFAAGILALSPDEREEVL